MVRSDKEAVAATSIIIERDTPMVKHMQRPLWELQALPGKLLALPTPETVKEIFIKDFFDHTGDKLRPRRFTDTEGVIVTAKERNFDHIFFKNGVFLIDRAERVYWIKKTILNARYIIQDKDSDMRFHYLQPYKVGEIVESFCVITERIATSKTSRIITAFPVDWERIYALMEEAK